LLNLPGCHFDPPLPAARAYSNTRRTAERSQPPPDAMTPGDGPPQPRPCAPIGEEAPADREHRVSLISAALSQFESRRVRFAHRRHNLSATCLPPDIFLNLHCKVIGGDAHAVSATEAAKLWRRRQISLPELQQGYVPIETQPRRRLRAPDIHLSGLRSSD
jgi:hypothetical protein